MAVDADLAAIERLVAGLEPAARQRLEKVVSGSKRFWRPNPGPQTLAVETEADELFYGGEAGGGKTDLVLGLALTDHERSLILRRTNKEAQRFIDRFSEIVGHRDGWNGQRQVFTLPGHVTEFGGVQLEDDKQKYKGSPHDLIAYDELPDFSETQFRFINGWNRSANPAQRCRIVATGNPPTRPEGLWVIQYWAPWLDPMHPNPAKSGELRWFTTIEGEDREVDGPGPHIIEGEAEPVRARSRTFIRARLSDNPDLSETDYAAVLSALPQELRDAYRDGKFGATMRDDAKQVIPTAWIDAAQARWRPSGGVGLSMTAMALDPAGGGSDAAELAFRHGGWYGPIDTTVGSATADGALSAMSILRLRRDGAIPVIDVGGGYAGAVIERLKDNAVEYVRFNGAGASSARSKERIGFYNKRAEAWWLFREALDPDQPDGSWIALPPGAELRADLAAPRWELTARGYKLESKDDIRDRLGRSPGKGDAVVMCWSEGTKAAGRRITARSRGGDGNGGSGIRVVRGYEKAKTRKP